MSATHTINENSAGVLRRLRGMAPERPMGFQDALQIAERQATRFRELLGFADEPALPTAVVEGLPRLSVTTARIPTSGVSYWSNGQWQVRLSAGEPRTRRRFTLMHEFKHIVDHGHTEELYRGTRWVSPGQQAEQAADYFAGCVLMPRTLMKRAWAAGMQRPVELAELFDVSRRAIEVRLAQLGLDEPTRRCDSRPLGPRSPRRYFRSPSLAWSA